MRRHCRVFRKQRWGSPGGGRTQDWLSWRQIFTRENTPAAQDGEDWENKCIVITLQVAVEAMGLDGDTADNETLSPLRHCVCYSHLLGLPTVMKHGCNED